MRKAEKILGFISLLALLFNLMMVPAGGVFSIISLSALSVFYMYMSFAVFNGIRLRHIFKKNTYTGLSIARFVGAIFTGIALTITIIGILFKIFYWSGANLNLIIGLSGQGLILLVAAFKYSSAKSEYYKRILKRITIIGGIGLIFLLLPANAWIHFKYRDYPAYIEALEKARSDPENQELWDKADEERDKF